MDQQENKKCPWCGEDVKMVSVGTEGCPVWCLACEDCTVDYLYIHIQVETEEDAWADWNKMKLEMS
jgi:hypothetical protein